MKRRSSLLPTPLSRMAGDAPNKVQSDQRTYKKLRVAINQTQLSNLLIGMGVSSFSAHLLTSRATENRIAIRDAMINRWVDAIGIILRNVEGDGDGLRKKAGN